MSKETVFPYSPSFLTFSNELIYPVNIYLKTVQLYDCFRKKTTKIFKYSSYSLFFWQKQKKLIRWSLGVTKDKLNIETNFIWIFRT